MRFGLSNACEHISFLSPPSSAYHSNISNSACICYMQPCLIWTKYQIPFNQNICRSKPCRPLVTDNNVSELTPMKVPEASSTTDRVAAMNTVSPETVSNTRAAELIFESKAEKSNDIVHLIKSRLTLSYSVRSTILDRKLSVPPNYDYPKNVSQRQYNRHRENKNPWLCYSAEENGSHTALIVCVLTPLHYTTVNLLKNHSLTGRMPAVNKHIINTRQSSTHAHTHTAHTLVGGQYLAGWPPRKTIRSSDSTRKALKYGALTNIYHIISYQQRGRLHAHTISECHKTNAERAEEWLGTHMNATFAPRAEEFLNVMHNKKMAVTLQ